MKRTICLLLLLLGLSFFVIADEAQINLEYQHKHNMIPYIAPLVLQKVELNKSQYVIASDVIAGRSVDSGRTNGDVTVKNGIEYEIEATGTVKIMGGFKEELGARFAIAPSEYNK